MEYFIKYSTFESHAEVFRFILADTALIKVFTDKSFLWNFVISCEWLFKVTQGQDKKQEESLI